MTPARMCLRPNGIPSRAVALVMGLLVLALVQASAWGQSVPGTVRAGSIPDGAEAVVTDRLGRRLVGYGRVAEGALRLSVVDRDEVDGLVLVLITPDGAFSRLEGRLTASGITVRDGLAQRSLEDWLALRGVTLLLERVDGARPRFDADDDREDEPARDDGDGDDGDDDLRDDDLRDDDGRDDDGDADDADHDAADDDAADDDDDDDDDPDDADGDRDDGDDDDD